jgi:hypothetical protein
MYTRPQPPQRHGHRLSPATRTPAFAGNTDTGFRRQGEMAPRPRNKHPKVFCFFFSKKKRFPAFVTPSTTRDDCAPPP